MPQWTVQVLLMAALCGAAYFFHSSTVEREVEKAREEARAGMVEESIHAAASLRLKEKEDEVASLRSNLNRTLRLLDSRPSRSSPAPQAASSCTGAELYREDGEFLAREAARAEKVRVERDYWYNQYEAARILLEKAKNGEN